MMDPERRSPTPRDTVTATYIVETFLPLERTAAAIANEQSTGTFVELAGETPDLKARFAAEVLGIDALPPSGRSSLPGARSGDGGSGGRPSRARIQIGFPADNFGPSIPNMLAAVAGNLFELRELAAIRLVDLDIPESFASAYAGPAFGVRGTRRLLGVEARPMIGTIIKPSIGLPLDDLAALVERLGRAGIDFIKDDELTGDPPHAPLRERVRVVTHALDRVEAETGRRPLYAFNITDDADRMIEHHDVVLESGGGCVMVCVAIAGFSALAQLRRRSELPIHGHRAMFGLFSRDPQIGIAFRVLQKLARLCGADHLHTNGIRNKFFEDDETVLAAIASVREPLLGGFECLPVLSSGQWAGLAHDTYRMTGTVDLLVMAGGGIHGHPDGPDAGVQAMRAAWEAAVNGTSLDVEAQRTPALRRAIEQFGSPP